MVEVEGEMVEVEEEEMGVKMGLVKVEVKEVMGELGMKVGLIKMEVEGTSSKDSSTKASSSSDDSAFSSCVIEGKMGVMTSSFAPLPLNCARILWRSWKVK